MFSVVDRIPFHSLHYRDSGRLVPIRNFRQIVHDGLDTIDNNPALMAPGRSFSALG